MTPSTPPLHALIQVDPARAAATVLQTFAQLRTYDAASQHLGVSRRTLIRHVQQLEALGYPMDFPRAQGGPPTSVRPTLPELAGHLAQLQAYVRREPGALSEDVRLALDLRERPRSLWNTIVQNALDLRLVTRVPDRFGTRFYPT